MEISQGHSFYRIWHIESISNFVSYRFQLDLLAFLDVNNPPIETIQETKIDSSIATSELFPETCPYNIFRKDRNLHFCGVMLVTQKDIPHMLLSELENDSESFWVKVFSNNKLLIMWQAGIVLLVAQVKTSNCFVISSIRSGINIKTINSPQFMFYGISTSRTLLGQTDLTSQVQC